MNATTIRQVIALGAVAAALYLLLTADIVLPALPLYLTQAALLIVVVVLVGFGAGWLVDGAANIAGGLGISDFVVGLTVVAFGTSAPEIAASLVAGLEGNGDVSVANIIGSNVFNLCLILGGVAVIRRGGIAVERAVVSRDGPVLLIGTIMMLVFVGGTSTVADAGSGGALSFFDFHLHRVEGAILTASLVLYIVWIYRTSPSQQTTRTTPVEGQSERGRAGKGTLFRNVLSVVVGLGVVVEGCRWLIGWAEPVDEGVRGLGALWFAEMWDLPDYLVGVTIVAAGTSAPELVVSLTAAIRGSHGISTGNLLGSATFNALGVLGLTGLVVQPPLSTAVRVSSHTLPGMVALLILMTITVLFMWTRRRLSRTEGLLLIALGLAYLIYDFVAIR